MRIQSILAISLILLALCLTPAALAATDREAAARQSMENALTEVYGYLAEEAQAFTYEVTPAEGGLLRVSAWPENHPDWVYSGETLPDKPGLNWDTFRSPFFATGQNDAPYPGQNAVMAGLRLLREENWLQGKNTEQRSSVADRFYEDGIHLSTGFRMAMGDADASPADFAHEFFVSCYGPMVGWNSALRAWHDEVIVSLGGDPAAFSGMPALGGAHRYRYNMSRQAEAETSSSVLPEDVRALEQEPRLQGWRFVCGAVAGESFRSGDSMMAVFERDGVRQLVTGLRTGDDGAWVVSTAGSACLLPEVPVDIVYSGAYFHIRMAVREDCLLTIQANVAAARVDEQPCARLERIEIEDYGTGEQLRVSQVGEDWSFVRTADGVRESFALDCALPYYLSQLDASALPMTRTDWRNCSWGRLTKGTAVARGAHLRGDHSSHSRDLGVPATGTAMEVLETVDGTAAPWYHVRIGRLEGWMSGNYVSEGVTEWLPAVARVRRDVSLKESAGLLGFLSATAAELPAGTELYVLLQQGGDCYVCVPENGLAWPMPTEGLYGYVPADSLTIVSDPAALAWVE